MYQLNQTIIAVSSPSSDGYVIIRISGSETTEKLNQFFRPQITAQQQGIVHGKITAADGLQIDVSVYLFANGRSYTGERLAEIHLYINSAVTESLLKRFLASGVRLAAPGEFTARAYLNGKMDLAQAEAVNKVITSGNRFQLNAAEKLLQGRLTDTVSKAAAKILDCLSLIEAGLDFTQEDIEFISRTDAQKRLEQIKKSLEEILEGSISYESVLDLPTVGIAGAPGAGKSSLLNVLLGQQRSIVSSQPKTTRDVLSGVLELEHCRCVIFDCAGLLSEPCGQIDELAQQAALGALNNAQLTIFCIDLAKEDLTEDLEVLNIFRCHCQSRKIEKAISVVFAAAKTDLLSTDDVSKRISQLQKLLGSDFLPISSKTGFGIQELTKLLDKILIEQTFGISKSKTSGESQAASDGVTLTARHKQSVSDAIENLTSAIEEIKGGNDEVAAVMLRAALQAISNIGHEHIDEKILDKIFSRFCIGK